MEKIICSIDQTAWPSKSLWRRAADLFLRVWSGADPEAPAVPAASRPQPGSVLHRLPDLRKFGPSIR